MAKMLVQMDFGYSDRLIVDAKDAIALAEIFDRSKVCVDKYDNNIHEFQDNAKPRMTLVTNEQFMTKEQYAAYKEDTKDIEPSES